MRPAAILAGFISIVTFAPGAARAELGAAGTRLSVAGGAPRFYMTYGHMDERELFAPITTELKRLKLMFLVEGDTCTVLHDGVKLAAWSVVRSREALPASPEQPFILILGSTTFVPVKRLAKLAPIELKRDRQANLLALVAGKKPAVAAAPMPTPSAPGKGGHPSPARLITVSAIELQAAKPGARIRVLASGPVKPSVHYLKNPYRVVVDFPNSRWPEGEAPPEGVEGVRSIRIGQPAPDRARLVLETTTALKVSGLAVSRGEVAVSVGGQPARAAAPSALRDQVRAAVERRAGLGRVQVAKSRGGLRLPEGSMDLETPVDNAWQYIVIHHSATSAGNAASFATTHRRNKWDGLAYHFVINNGKGNPDGLLEISPRWMEQKHGAHAGGLPGVTDPEIRNGFNEFGIGICLVGSFQRSGPTEKQLETLALLIRELREQFDIPAENVLGHGSVKSTACPGAAFPWGRLFTLLDLPAPERHRHAIPQTTARCPWCQLKESEK